MLLSQNNITEQELAVKHWGFTPRILLIALLVSGLFHLLLAHFWDKYSQINKFASVNISANLKSLPKAANSQPATISKDRESSKKPNFDNKPKIVPSQANDNIAKLSAQQNISTQPMESSATSNNDVHHHQTQAAEANNDKASEIKNDNSAATKTASSDNDNKNNPNSQANTFPKKGRLHFSIYYGEYVGKKDSPSFNIDASENKTPSNTLLGKAMHEWEIKDGNYRLHTVADTAGMVSIFKSYRIEQESKGLINNEGFIPYSLKTFRNHKETDEKADFDWKTLQIVLGRGEDKVKSLQPGTQDLVSFAYQLAFLDTSKNQQFMVATGKKFELYQFRYLGEEQINLPLLQTKAQHLRTERGNTALDIWIAREYLPVPLRIKLTDKDGRIADQVLEQVEIE